MGCFRNLFGFPVLSLIGLQYNKVAEQIRWLFYHLSLAGINLFISVQSPDGSGRFQGANAPMQRPPEVPKLYEIDLKNNYMLLY